MAANIHTYIHTTSANAVTLVWGSLRLAPIKNQLCGMYCIFVAWSTIETLTLYQASFQKAKT